MIYFWTHRPQTAVWTVATSSTSRQCFLVNFAKNNSNLVILGGIMNNEILSVEKIEILSKLPSLEEARAQLIGLLKTPAQKIATILNAPSGDLARVFNAYGSK